MYNEALMVRKVKAYLNTIKSTYDEEVLQKLSLEIEPPQVCEFYIFICERVCHYVHEIYNIINWQNWILLNKPTFTIFRHYIYIYFRK